MSERERCSRDGKALDHNGRCLHCGTHYPMTTGMPMTQPEVKELVRQVRLMSGSCKSRRHDQCQVSSCECWHHNPEARQRYAAHLRREAAEMEHRAGRRLGRAEELRRRADEAEA